MKISQEDGARLMWAAQKWASAEGVYWNAEAYGTREEMRDAATRCHEAEQAFAALVAQLTDSEGL